MIVRPCRDDDAGPLARIFHDAVQGSDHYTQVQRDEWSAEAPTAGGWRERLEGLTTWVAEEDGAPVGFLSLDLESGLLDLMFVQPAHARRGVGALLYAAALEDASARGLTELTVEASAASEPFFRARGWRETGRRTRGEGAGKVETVMMALDLPGAAA